MSNNLIIIPLFIICLIAGFYQLFAISNVVNFSGTQQINQNIGDNQVNINTAIQAGLGQNPNSISTDFTVEL